MTVNKLIDIVHSQGLCAQLPSQQCLLTVPTGISVHSVLNNVVLYWYIY